MLLLQVFNGAFHFCISRIDQLGQRRVVKLIPKC